MNESLESREYSYDQGFRKDNLIALSEEAFGELLDELGIDPIDRPEWLSRYADRLADALGIPRNRPDGFDSYGCREGSSALRIEAAAKEGCDEGTAAYGPEGGMLKRRSA